METGLNAKKASTAELFERTKWLREYIGREYRAGGIAIVTPHDITFFKNRVSMSEADQKANLGIDKGSKEIMENAEKVKKYCLHENKDPDIADIDVEDMGVCKSGYRLYAITYIHGGKEKTDRPCGLFEEHPKCPQGVFYDDGWVDGKLKELGLI
jgi:hypothetical protein